MGCSFDRPTATGIRAGFATLSSCRTTEGAAQVAALPVPVVAVVGRDRRGQDRAVPGPGRGLGGEIVNTDAMQVYRGMDIGTAKLPGRGAPRHPAPPAGPARRHRAGDRGAVPGAGPRRASTTAGARGVVPVLVGGSALYTRAVLDRLRVPRHRPRRCGPGSRPSWTRSAPATLHRAARRGRPRGRGADHPRQRPPRRAGPGGRGDHRPAVQRDAARPDVRLRAHRAGRRPHPAAGPRRADRAAGAPDVGRGPGRGGTTPGRRRAARGPHGAPGARLPAGARVPRRRVLRGRRRSSGP